MLTKNLTGSLGHHVREVTDGRLRWNRFGFRIVVSVIVLAAVLLSAASCGGSSAKSSRAKKHFEPRELYIINANTGAIDQDFPDVDIENYGIAYAAVSDGSGGWYIGGNFNRVGKASRYGLARLRSDGSLDPEFAPRLPKGTYVVAIVRHGNVVYVDTSATDSASGMSVVAAFDARSGRKLWQVPTNKGDWLAGGLAFAKGTLFVGGVFTWIAGVPRSGLAALDPRTGRPTSWQVHLANGREAQGRVEAMSIENGVIYYAGFYKGTKMHREYLGAASARTGQVTSWNPQHSDNEPLGYWTILATHGQVLVGGNGFVVYDARTGRILPWYERLEGCLDAFALSGNTVYLGSFPWEGCGSMISAGGKRVHSLAAVVLPSGRVTTNWRPMMSPTPDVGVVLAVSGQNVLMSGAR
jgi:hypothetical protein